MNWQAPEEDSPHQGRVSPHYRKQILRRRSEPFGQEPLAGRVRLDGMGAFDRLAVKPGLAPMEAKLVDALPEGPGWQYEPKWDGFRCLVFRDGGDVDLRSKSGKPLGRYFPEVAAAIGALKAKRLVLDGELIIPVGGILSFEALQMRLHPAESRVRKLAAETPAQLMLFDCLLSTSGRSLLEKPLSERRDALERFRQRRLVALEAEVPWGVAVSRAGWRPLRLVVHHPWARRRP